MVHVSTTKGLSFEANNGGGVGQGLRTKELFAAGGSEQYWGGGSRIRIVRVTYFVRLL